MLSKHNVLIFIVSGCLLVGLGYIFLPQNLKKSVNWRIKRQYLILTGHLVSVGDYRLRIECQGIGSPTVVLDSGLNMPMESWENVPQEVSKFTRVCVYERAGIGDSDASTKQIRTGKDAVADLHALLQNSGEKAPFLLVGHSFGGQNVRLYSSLYPQEVVGLVLVDSSHPDQYQRYANLRTPDEREKYLSHEGGENDERINLLASAEEIKSAPSIPPIPLIVLSAEKENPDPGKAIFAKDHNELQADLINLSPKAKLISIKNSGHFIQKDRPDAVIEAIKTIYENTAKTQK